jgi:hypothetical protein
MNPFCKTREDDHMKTPKTPKAPEATDTKLAQNETLNGSNTLPALIEIAEGKTVQLGEVVAVTFEASGLTVEAWNELAESDRDTLLKESIEYMVAASAPKKTTVIAKDTVNVAPVPDTEKKKEEAGPLATVVRRIRHNGKRIAPGEYSAAAIRAFFKDDEEASFTKLVNGGSIVLPEGASL